MTLQNLAKIGQLKPHSATAEEVQRLLAAVCRNLADAGRAGNSTETRFDCAYKAIMQCALVAMLASGYRPSTSAPGHHQTMIQSLPHTLGVSNDTWIVLDALRKKRNLNDYRGRRSVRPKPRKRFGKPRHCWSGYKRICESSIRT